MIMPLQLTRPFLFKTGVNVNNMHVLGKVTLLLIDMQMLECASVYIKITQHVVSFESQKRLNLG